LDQDPDVICQAVPRGDVKENLFDDFLYSCLRKKEGEVVKHTKAGKLKLNLWMNRKNTPGSQKLSANNPDLGGYSQISINNILLDINVATYIEEVGYILEDKPPTLPDKGLSFHHLCEGKLIPLTRSICITITNYNRMAPKVRKIFGVGLQTSTQKSNESIRMKKATNGSSLDQ
jgi:hypothetical protein